MLQDTQIANLATAITLVMASVFLIAVTSRMKTPFLPLKNGMRVVQISTILLGSFLFVHGMFHLSQFFNDDDFEFLYPLSVALLLTFAFYVKAKLFVPVGSKAFFPSDLKKGSSLIEEYRFGIISAIALAVITVAFSFFTDDYLDIFALMGIFLSMALFVWMFVKNPSTQTWHFGFAMITVVWGLAEIPYVLSSAGVIETAGLDFFGTWVHFVSMGLIGFFVCYRAAKITFTQSPIIDDEPVAPEIQKTTARRG